MSSRNIRGSALALLVDVVVAVLSSARWRRRLTTYEYEKDRLYPVRTGLGLTTQIEVMPDREAPRLQNTGFSSGWELTRRENVFYLQAEDTSTSTPT